MDDIIILSNDKMHLASLKTQIENYLDRNLRLSLNAKTAVRPVSLGIEFVGYVIFATHKKLKKQTARRIIRRVKSLCMKIPKEPATKAEFMRIAASYNGVLRHCDCYGLREKLNRFYAQSKGVTAKNGAMAACDRHLGPVRHRRDGGGPMVYPQNATTGRSDRNT
jgi:hypothetical protein